MKAQRGFPQPPWGYTMSEAGHPVPPAYALVGKAVMDPDGKIATFHLVLECTATGEPATPSEMNAFMQAILDAFKC